MERNFKNSQQNIPDVHIFSIRVLHLRNHKPGNFSLVKRAFQTIKDQLCYHFDKLKTAKLKDEEESIQNKNSAN